MYRSIATLCNGRCLFAALPACRCWVNTAGSGLHRSLRAAGFLLSGQRWTPGITLDLGAPFNLNGLRYLPRQSGGSNGIITGYTISASTDGTTFTPVTSGSWAADAAEKSATFTARSARYLRLTATAGVGGFANAAELTVLGSPR